MKDSGKMDVNNIETTIKISELNVKTANEINRIAYHNEYFVPCTSEVKNEDICFTFDISGLKSTEEIRKKREVEKLRFLINVSSILELTHEFVFTLEPDNIYCDYNFNVKIKMRDLKPNDEIVNTDDFILQYKSLIGYLFMNKYKYEDFYNGGISLLKKNKKTEAYIDLESIEDIKNKLLEDLKAKEKEDSEKYIEIKKRDYSIKRFSIYGMSAVIAILAAYTIYTSVFLIPFQKNVIKADNYYSDKNYEGVIKSLEKTRGMKLDKESKYKLAYSYIISENLSENQKKNITLALDEKSDENVMDYWIAIGKSDYDTAIDLGKKVQDDELLLYALLSKEKSVQDNTKMSGEEKQKAQEELESQIEKINKELNGDKDSSKNKILDSADNKSGSGTAEDASKDANTSTASAPDAASSQPALNLNPNN